MSGRTIRPRPLSYTERIPVIFLDRREDDAGNAETQPVDPALEQFLRNCEEEREREQHALLSGLEYSRKKRRKQSSSQPSPRKSGVSAPPIVAGGSQQGAGPSSAGAAAAIAVPGCREIADYGANEEAMAKADARKELEVLPSVPLVPGLLPEVAPALAALSGLGTDAAAYIIYQDVVRGRRAESALLQYDMDEQDDRVMADVNASLQRAAGNASNRQSGNGAARAPPATRSAAAAAAAALAAQLDEDSYEGLVGVLERAHFDALQQRKELWQAEVKTGKVPKLPAADKILPWDAAVAAVKAHLPPLPPLPRTLYNHWLKRRKQEGGPLLGYLWYEQPWKAICFQERRPGQEAQQGDMPFMATETKNSARSAWNRVRMDKKEAHERLFEVREELELLRTLADQVRKRERLKKQLLKLYRAEVCAKLGLHLHAHAHAKNPVAPTAGAAAGPGAAPAGAAAARRQGAGPSARPTASAPPKAAAAATAAAAAGPAAAASSKDPAAAAGGSGPHRQPPQKRRRLLSEPGEQRTQPAPAEPQANTVPQLPQQPQRAARGRLANGRLQRKGAGSEAAQEAEPSARAHSAPGTSLPGPDGGGRSGCEPEPGPPQSRARSTPLRRASLMRQPAQPPASGRKGGAQVGPDKPTSSGGGGGSSSQRTTPSSSVPSSSEGQSSGGSSSSGEESSGEDGDVGSSPERSGSGRPSSSTGGEAASESEGGGSEGGPGGTCPSPSEAAAGTDDEGTANEDTGTRGGRTRRTSGGSRGRGAPGTRSGRSEGRDGEAGGADAQARRRTVQKPALAARRPLAGAPAPPAAARAEAAPATRRASAGAGARSVGDGGSIAQRAGKAAVQRSITRQRAPAGAAPPATAVGATGVRQAAGAGPRGTDGSGGRGGGGGGAPTPSADAAAKPQGTRGRGASRGSGAAAAAAPPPRSSPSRSSPTRSDRDRPSSSSSPERSRSPPPTAAGRRGRSASRAPRPAARGVGSAGPASGGEARKEAGQRGRTAAGEPGARRGAEPLRVRFAGRPVVLSRTDKSRGVGGGRASGRGGTPRGRRELDALLLKPPSGGRSTSGAVAAGAGAPGAAEPLACQLDGQAADPAAAGSSQHGRRGLGPSRPQRSALGAGRGLGRSLLAGPGRKAVAAGAAAAAAPGDDERAAGQGAAVRGKQDGSTAGSRGRGEQARALAGGSSGRKRPPPADAGTGAAAPAQPVPGAASKQLAADASKAGHALRKVREGGVSKVFTRRVPLLRERNGSSVPRLSAAGAAGKGPDRPKG